MNKLSYRGLILWLGKDIITIKRIVLLVFHSLSPSFSFGQPDASLVQCGILSTTPRFFSLHQNTFPHGLTSLPEGLG